jgi:hypothetical protein
MRKALLTAAIGLLGLAAIPARAMPVAPLDGAAPAVTLVAFGCGPGWTRGPYGRCHPMGYVARPAYGFYGYRPYAHPYAYGRCWWRGGVRVCA